jgi:hypothetical protein
MPVEMSIAVPQDQLDKFTEQTRRLIPELNMSLAKSVEWAAGAIIKAVAATTAVAPKRRTAEKRIVEEPRFRKDGKPTKKPRRIAQWGVIRHDNRDHEPRWNLVPGARTKSDALRNIRAQIFRRGLAKAAWWWIGKRRRSSVPSTGANAKTLAIAERNAETIAQLKGNAPYILLRSRLGYAEAALRGGPKSIDTIMSRASGVLRERINDALAKKAAAISARGAA